MVSVQHWSQRQTPVPDRKNSETALFFSVNTSFLRISLPSGYNQQNGKKSLLPPLSFKINLKDISFRISLNYLRLYLSPECSLNLLSNIHIPACVGNTLKFREFIFLKNPLTRGICTLAPPHSKLAHKILSLRPKQKEITHSPDRIISKICFL